LPMAVRRMLPEEPAMGWHVWCCFLFWALPRNDTDLAQVLTRDDFSHVVPSQIRPIRSSCTA
jgi:hypothetical protein